MSRATRIATVLGPLAWIACATPLAPLAAQEPSEPAGPPRVIVVALAGLDLDTTLEMLDADELPNLAALRESGTFAPLRPVVPIVEPVGWAAFQTGRGSGENGIPGFIAREVVGEYVYPTFGFQETTVWTRGADDDPSLPREVERFTNLLEGTSFWRLAGRAGKRAVVLGVGQTQDEEETPNVRLLAGDGVLDARGGLGDWWIVTDDPSVDRGGESTGTAGTRIRADRVGGALRAEIPGPTNVWRAAELGAEMRELERRLDDRELRYSEAVVLRERQDALQEELTDAQRTPIPLPLIVRRDGERARVALGDEEQVLAAGEWSDYYHPSFPLHAGLAIHAVTRVKLIGLAEPFRLLVARLDVDPAAPPAWHPVSTPASFSRELVEAGGGPFETFGWACLTMPYKDGEIDEQTLMEDVEFTLAWRERLTRAVLARDDWDLLVTAFHAPDRVQHMMYRHFDEAHPLYDADVAATRVRVFGRDVALSDTIPEIYRQTDRVVGEIAGALRPDDLLIVASIGGFESFARQVDLNAWLHEHGYLALKEELSTRDRHAMRYVDWSATRAYAMGLGNVYANVRGREPNGIVAPAEVPHLLDAIERDLLETVDGETGARVGAELHRMDELHACPRRDRSPDAVVGFRPGYRIAWVSTAGGIGLDERPDGTLTRGPVFLDNTSRWSGCHPTVAVAAVSGVLFSNRPADLEGDAHLLQIAPTVLRALGVAVPPEMDGAPIAGL